MKFILFLIFISVNSFSQNLIEPNEERILSFKTKGGKTMMIAKEKTNKYIVYRFGKDNNIELEFPKKDIQSWKLFTYSFYFRGGGKQNAGLDIDNLKFEKDGHKYVVYVSYNAGDEENKESYSFGIIIYDQNNKRTQIKGIPETEVGNLQSLKTNELLIIDNGFDFEE